MPTALDLPPLSNAPPMWPHQNGLKSATPAAVCAHMSCSNRCVHYPIRPSSRLMAIRSGQARPAITQLNAHKNIWPKNRQGKSNNSPRVAKPEANAPHPLQHVHYHNFRLSCIARSGNEVPKGTRDMRLVLSVSWELRDMHLRQWGK